MREIKFKIWNNHAKVMMHEDGFNILGETVLCGEVLRMPNDLSAGIDHLNDLIVLQFTRLYDKNGKEIYEGDILRYPPLNKWQEDNYSCFECFFHDNDGNSDYNIGWSIARIHNHGSIAGGFVPSFKPSYTSLMVVAGNIYQNPELIKQ